MPGGTMPAVRVRERAKRVAGRPDEGRPPRAEEAHPVAGNRAPPRTGEGQWR
ncbi:hypothetical protein [Streptomyces camponoticapitis]|uniref:hypothetical protein n=1 Tax=Streptomyces camponoticapitis TaxID=1616125 RepID=UPI0016691EB8|nr:hypothetical protein [Streptomyces camponoticapitis]